MFTFSKLTNLALGLLTLGSVGGIVIPSTLGSSIPAFNKDTDWSNIDLSTLIASEKAISAQLTSSKNRYSNALAWLQKLKGIKFHKILEAFSKLFKTEGEIESNYKQAQTKLKELSEILPQKGAELVKKLQADKATKSLSLVEKGLSNLQQGLKTWQEGFQKIICALKNEGSEEGGCGNGASRAKRSAPSAGGGTNGPMKGEKAKQSLEEVKQALEKTNKEIESVQNMAKELQNKASNMKTYQEGLSASSSLLLLHFSSKESSIQKAIKDISEQIKQLSAQVKSLTKEIETINKAMELLKKNIGIVKSWEGKFLNALCGLYTVEAKECKPEEQNS